MPDPLAFRWCLDGWAAALAAAEALAGVARAGGAWPAGVRVAKDRPMRVTFATALPGPDGPCDAFVKVRRLRTTIDRLRAGRRPRGPAEGAVLRALSARGVAVPEVLGWAADADAGLDLLVTRTVPAAVDLDAYLAAPRSARERRATAQAVATLLRAAHDAGWSDRDVHRGNILFGPTGATLVDPGTRAPGAPLPLDRRIAALAAAAHGLAPDPRAGVAALRTYAAGDRDAARRWFPLVAHATRRVTRAYRRGRARRPTRTGLHFEVFTATGGGRAVRNVDATPAAWRDLASAWAAAPPAGATSLKDGGSVVALAVPGRAGDVVIKRYGATWRDRLRVPRAIRAFRRAYALRIRGVACPEPLVAVTDATGGGIYVAARAGTPTSPAVDLHAALVPDRDGRRPIDALAARERRAALRRLGRTLRRMHDADVVHRDLKAPNLVAWRGPRGVTFAIVDLEGARGLARAVPWRRRARDLARLDASAGPAVSRADRRRVLAGYLEAWARPGMTVREFARRVARHAAEKRGPSGRPR